jgi:TPR repeat protein
LKQILFILIFCSCELFSSYLDDARVALKSGNITKAIKYYKYSIAKNNTEASYELAKYYYNGKYIKRDIKKAIKYFRFGYEVGDTKSAYALANIYANKRFKSTHNYKKALNIFLELSNKNHTASQNRVGMFYTYGLGVKKDYKKAVSFYKKAVANNNQNAKCNLAMMYASGYGVFPNFGRANKLAIDGYKSGNKICTRVWKEYKLYKYKEDKGFSFF